MRIGFFGGSFNPPTIAHVNLCKEAIEKCGLDKIYIVPVSDMYKKKNLSPYKFRSKMLEIALKDVKNIEVSNIEERLERNICAVEAFEIIENIYPNDDIYFLMGMDNYKKIDSWKEYEKLKKYKYIVFERENDEVPKNIETQETIFIFAKNVKNISSTKVRELILNGENTSHLINKDVEDYIINNNLYKNV